MGSKNTLTVHERNLNRPEEHILANSVNVKGIVQRAFDDLVLELADAVLHESKEENSSSDDTFLARLQDLDRTREEIHGEIDQFVSNSLKQIRQWKDGPTDTLPVVFVRYVPSNNNGPSSMGCLEKYESEMTLESGSSDLLVNSRICRHSSEDVSAASVSITFAQEKHDNDSVSYSSKRSSPQPRGDDCDSCSSRPTCSGDNSFGSLGLGPGAFKVHELEVSTTVKPESTCSGHELTQYDIDLKGPRSARLMHVEQVVVQLQSKVVYDIAYYWPSFLFCASDGLWFCSHLMAEPVKVHKKNLWNVCFNSGCSHAYATDSRNGRLVRKFDMRAGIPVKVGSFRVGGGKSLAGIACSPKGLIAICDIGMKRVTVHNEDGGIVSELIGLFDDGRPYKVVWVSDYQLCVKVAKTNHYSQWVVCVQLSTREKLWKSECIPWAWMVSYCNAQLFVSTAGSPVLIVVDVTSGEIQNEPITCSGDHSASMNESEDALVAVSLKLRI